MAHCFNRVFIEDDQIKADENRWKAVRASTPLIIPEDSWIDRAPVIVPSVFASPFLGGAISAPPSISIPVSLPPVSLPPGDPMDLDMITTAQQATQLVKGKKLTDQIRQVCNQFDLCLFCREAGHRLQECPRRQQKASESL